MYKNIFYFKSINKIGGTEQYLYEIAKKYHKYDITIFYDRIDTYQLKRLRKLVRCRQRIKGEKIKCEKAFYNYNIDMIEDVEAKEQIFVCHGIYQILGIKPPIDHPKLTKAIAVSEYANKMLKEYADKIGVNIPIETCYNPLTIEPKEEVKVIVSACRLNDRVKGGDRTLKLIEVLDRHCENTKDNYLWLIFSNPISKTIDSPNAVLMKPRIDIRPYIAKADYVAQLSDDMETYCFTTNEALSYGVPIITTPLSVNKELGITPNENIILNYDCSNIEQVVNEIFKKEVKSFKYTPPKDRWEDLLDKTKSKYKEEKEMKYKVEALDTYTKRNITDGELGYKPKEGEVFEVSQERLDTLLGNNQYHIPFVKLVEEKKEEPKKTTTRKTIKKNK